LNIDKYRRFENRQGWRGDKRHRRWSRRTPPAAVEL